VTNLTVKPLSDHLGAEVTGVDLRHLDVSVGAALNEAFDRHSVLCLRDQQLDKSQLRDVAKLFGEPCMQVNEFQRTEGVPEVSVLSSDHVDVHGTGERVIGGTTWHTDHSFTATPPKATLLYAVEIPTSGGETSFCNMRAAHAALDDSMRDRVDGLRAVHCYESSRSPRRMMTRTTSEREATPDVVHPLVRRNPASGAAALYLSTTRLECIEGMAREASDALLDELFAHATQSCFTYDHEWRLGDVLVWDNRCLMHHANANYALSERRVMHRAMVNDSP